MRCLNAGALAAFIVQAALSGNVIFDFTQREAIEGWRSVDDVVMGGLSSSEIVLTGRSTAVFRGTVSLENRGGFASVRSGRGQYDLSGFEGIEVRVLGDGRSYQLRLRTEAGFGGVAYKYDFETHDGEWITVRAPFEDFVPTFRGRVMRDHPPLDPSGVRHIGFLIADGIKGPFRLEIDVVRVYPGGQDSGSM